MEKATRQSALNVVTAKNCGRKAAKKNCRTPKISDPVY